ncbi:MAG: hypothetical protein ACYCWK_05815 [Cuniculiplasma sp.]
MQEKWRLRVTYIAIGIILTLFIGTQLNLPELEAVSPSSHISHKPTTSVYNITQESMIKNFINVYHRVNAMLLDSSNQYLLSKNSLCNFFSEKISNNTPFSLIIYGEQHYRANIINTWQNSLRSQQQIMSVQLAHPVNGNKNVTQLDTVLLTAPVVVMGFNPDSIFIINGTSCYYNGVVWALEMFANSFDSSMTALASVSGTMSPLSKTVNGMNFIGTIGWFTQYVSGPSSPNGGTGNALRMEEYTSYYSTSQNTSQGTYYLFLAYNKENACGYSYGGFNWGIPFGPYYANYNPDYYSTEINWETSSWAGQQLLSWGPLNSGSFSTISYSLSAGTNGVSIGIQYSVPGGLGISWTDESNPAAGIEKTNETISATTQTSYTVIPSGVSVLNPTLPGGHPPMEIVQHYYLGSFSQVSFERHPPSLGVSFTTQSILLYPNGVYYD